MVLTAVRGGIGFLSRLPIGRDEAAWHAFRQTPVAFVIVGYLIGFLLVVPLLVPVPEPTLALLFVGWLYLLTGITHLDGLADLGDALVVHGDQAARRDVMQDTIIGVGGTLCMILAILGLAAAALQLAAMPTQLLVVVVAAEVSAKLGMAALACLGTAAHDGFGAAVTENLGPASLILPTLLALPALVLTWPHPAAAGTVIGGLAGAAAVFWIANRRLGGINGDVLGASNEVSRLVALHAGVITWTLS